MLARRFQRFDHADDRKVAAIGRRIAGARRILQAQFHRVHAQLRRRLVKEGLNRHESGRRCRRAISAHRLLVRHHIGRFQPQIRAAIKAGELHRRESAKPARIHARVRRHIGLHGDQRAIALESQLAADAQRRRRIGAQQFFAARQYQADRSADSGGDQGNQGFVQAKFGAERAADRHAIDRHVRFRYAQHLGDIVAYAEGRLNAAPHRQATVQRIGLRDPALCFDRALMHHRRIKTALDNHVRLSESGVDIARFHLGLARDI